MSALSNHLEDYLSLRRALGYRLVADGRALADFVAHLDDNALATVTAEAALSWAVSRGASANGIARRLSMVRRFCSYLVAFDDKTEAPPPHLVRADQSRTPPHLYSGAEVTALMAAASRLLPPLWAASLSTLIGLMAATGLRTGEVVRLDRSDVDVGAAVLSVRTSKLGKSRQVPLHPATAAALADYVVVRDQMCPEPVAPSFLVSATGTRIGSEGLGAAFRALVADCGIASATGRAPRLADLRHSFAVQTLLDWHDQGVDVQARLPALSTYLGHLNPSSTYWYLEAAPEFMATVAARLERFLGGPR